ncbi:MAG: hypothetical protein K8R74_12565 [Bacteroidales bacterium]|nr:hypothetical protein [Bacteroidales bacterium]
MIRKILIITSKSFLFFILFLFFIISIKYITCPVYNFKPSKPFSGKHFYNPYSNIDSSFWRKANFQIQSYAWSGITSGRGNTNEKIHDIYNRLGYDIIATSDYQKINRYRQEDPDYIPVYEHGYGIKKNHQVLIGAQKVLWKDYPIFQTIHNKQHILNLLKEENELVYIAHPKLRHGYEPVDMEKLSNYDGIEVLNNYRTSLEHWDAALSSGNYVTVLGNDDAHDITNPDEIGHHCTFIQSPAVNRADILAALKTGNSFGAKIYRPNGESLKDKIKRTKILPNITAIEIITDTLLIRFDSIAREVRFIGQNGKNLLTINHTKNPFYVIQDADAYIRTEIEFYSNSVFYLNPVCRTDDKLPTKKPTPEINLFKTLILRILGFATLIFIFLNYFLLRNKFRSRKRA